MLQLFHRYGVPALCHTERQGRPLHRFPGRKITARGIDMYLHGVTGGSTVVPKTDGAQVETSSLAGARMAIEGVRERRTFTGGARRTRVRLCTRRDRRHPLSTGVRPLRETRSMTQHCILRRFASQNAPANTAWTVDTLGIKRPCRRQHRRPNAKRAGRSAVLRCRSAAWAARNRVAIRALIAILWRHRLRDFSSGVVAPR